MCDDDNGDNNFVLESAIVVVVELLLLLLVVVVVVEVIVVVVVQNKPCKMKTKQKINFYSFYQDEIEIVHSYSNIKFRDELFLPFHTITKTR